MEELDALYRLYALYLSCSNVTTDTRLCKEGALFFALSGENYNGNQFAQEALAKGCIAAVVDDPSLKNEHKCFYVSDVLLELQELALYHRKQLNIPVLAITGTNGKTSTKELIAKVLSQKYKVAFTVGNLNNHIGVPCTVLSIKKEHQIAIVEMGANHVGEIASLCKIAQPTAGLITNVGKAHLQGFGSFEGVKQAKRELYEYLSEHGGTIFINGNNSHLVAMKEGFSFHSVQEYIGGNHPCITGEVHEKKMQLQFKWCNILSPSQLWFEVSSPIVGDYNFENAMAAIAVGLYYKVDEALINHAIASYVPSNCRSQRIQTKKNTLILDAYNANPSSMQVAVDNFSKIAGGILILGDMMELGESAHDEHLLLLKSFAPLSFKKIFLVGSHFYACRMEVFDHYFFFFKDLSSLKVYLEKEPLQKETILIKGSRSMKMEELQDYL